MYCTVTFVQYHAIGIVLHTNASRHCRVVDTVPGLTREDSTVQYSTGRCCMWITYPDNAPPECLANVPFKVARRAVWGNIWEREKIKNALDAIASQLRNPFPSTTHQALNSTADPSPWWPLTNPAGQSPICRGWVFRSYKGRHLSRLDGKYCTVPSTLVAVLCLYCIPCAHIQKALSSPPCHIPLP